MYYEGLYKSEFKPAPDNPPIPGYGFGMMFDSYINNKTMAQAAAFKEYKLKKKEAAKRKQ